MLNLNEYLEQWCHREWNAKYADQVYQELLDVITGNRDGNKFEREAVTRILAEYEKYKQTQS